jgi:hypothetical protein
LTGRGTVGPAAPVVDNGTIVAKGGGLDIGEAVTGAGTLLIDSGATLLAHAKLAVNTVFASGGNETLALAHGTAATGMIAGFAATDIIDLRHLAATSLSFANGTLSVGNNGHIVDTLFFAGDYTQADFGLTSDGNNGTDIIFANAAPVAAPVSSLHIQDNTPWHETVPTLLPLQTLF